jgi:hypothetical protein
VVWPPLSIPGWQWVLGTFDDEFVDGHFLPTATAATAVAVVRALPVDGSLQFLDWHYHGQPPDMMRDYGAIVCAYRDHRGQLFVTCGNHGWSGRWNVTTEPRLADFFYESRSSVGGARATPDSDFLRIYRSGHHRPRNDNVSAHDDALMRSRLYGPQ